MRASVFAGRAGALTHLRTVIARALEGGSGVAVLLGAAGAGKTRAIAEAVGSVQSDTGLLAFSGQCAGVSQVGEAFLPYKEILLGLAELAAAEDSGTRFSAKWLETARELVPDVLNLLFPGTGIAAKLGNALLLHRRRDASSAEQNDRNILFCLVREALFELAKRQPLVLIIDDLHWADPATLELTHYVTSGMEDLPLVFIFGVRTEDPTAAVIPARCRALVRELQIAFGNVLIRVGAESGERCREFVRAFVAINYEPHAFHGDFLDKLAGATGDNALFVQEFLRHLEDQKLVYQDGKGIWLAHPEVDWQSLPPRVEAAVQARLEELDDESRVLATVAATEGVTFHSQVVAGAAGRDVDSTTDAIIQRLVKRFRLVDETEMAYTSDGRELYTFQFVHQLFPSALLGHCGVIEKVRLHRAVLRALDLCYPADDPVVLSQRFEHACAARDGTRAAELGVQLGRQLLASYAPQSSLAVTRRAQALVGARAQQAWLTTLEAEALEALGRYEQGERLATEALDAAREANDEELLLHAMHVQSVLLRRRARFADARQIAEELFTRASTREEGRWCGIACRDVGRAAESEGRYQESLNWYARALPFVSDDERLRCGLTEKLAYSSYRSGAFTEAEKYYGEAIRLARATKDLGVGGSATLNLGILRLAQGRFSDSTQLIEESLSVRRRIGAPVQLAQTLNNLALVSALKGHQERAVAASSESVGILEGLEDPLHLAIAVDVAGTVFLLAGLTERALEEYERAAEISEEISDVVRSRHITLNQAAAAFIMGNQNVVNQCRSRFGEAKRGDPLDGPFAVILEGYAEHLTGGREAAAECFHLAAIEFEEIGDRRFASRAALNATRLGAVDERLRELCRTSEDSAVQKGDAFVPVPRM